MSRLSVLGVIALLFLIAIAVVVTVVVIVVIVSKKNTNGAIPQPIILPEKDAPLPCNEPVTDIESAFSPKRSLGETIKQHRIRCGMTQEYVAETLNVSRQAVSKWETDSSDPSTSNLLALAKLFGISPAELLENIE